MKLAYKVNENCTLEADVPNMKAAFKAIAYAQEIFSIKKCGNPACESTNLRLKFRTAMSKDGKKCEYYSIVCADCGWEYKFGQKQDEGQTLFPKGWEPPFRKEEKSNTNGRQRQEESSDEPEYAMAGDSSTGGF